ncbi:hypothetical protein F2Q70_00037123 [Brassica cretica]|uniref:Uncharacterized protein n=1 Tax=Brassica cretica TaxID=69181 RepID=A0A8S9JXA6_BRACR|nr:hypothetical protein F2Q70_00037123 [Brassica cretica]
MSGLTAPALAILMRFSEPPRETDFVTVVTVEERMRERERSQATHVDLSSSFLATCRVEMKRRSRVGETRLSLPKSISPSSDSLSTAMLVAIKFTDDFTSNLSRIPHESIPSLSPTSFSADFNLKEAKEIERDGVRAGRVVSEKTWEGARFRRTPFDSVAVFTTTTTVTSFSLSVLIMFFFVGRAGGREQRRQYGGTQDWYVSGQDLRWLHLLTTTTAATPVKRDAAVVQAGGGVVVVRWRCGGD